MWTLVLCLSGLMASATPEAVADAALVQAVYTERYRDNPNDFKTAYVLGLATYARGAYPQALALFEHAAALSPSAHTAALARAMTLRAAGDAPGARQALLVATQKKVAPADVWFDLGLAHLQAGSPAEAALAFAEAARLAPDVAAAHYNAGVAFLTTGDAAEARRSLERAKALAPTYGPIWNGLGTAAAFQGQADNAIVLFQRAGLATATAYYNLGVAQMDAGDFRAAAEAYTHAIHADPNLAQAHCNLGVVEDVLAQKEATFQSFLRVTTLLPDFVDGRYNLGLAYFRQGEAAAALVALKDVVQRQPDHADAWLHLGAVYLEMGQPQASGAALKTAAELMTYGGTLTARTGERLLYEGRFAEALQLYGQRVRVLPESVPDHVALADAAIAQKQWQLATRALQEAVRLAPDDSVLRRRLTETFLQAGALERALQEAKRAVSAWPASAEHRATLAEVQWRQGLRDQAESNFSLALTLQQDNIGALAGLARTWLARGAAADVVTLLEPRARGHVHDAALDTELALAYRQLGHADKAARWFEAAARDGPDSALVWFNLGVAQIAAHRMTEARTSLTKAVHLDANAAEAYYFLAVIAQRAGNRGEATRQARAALRLDARHTEAARLLTSLTTLEP